MKPQFKIKDSITSIRGELRVLDKADKWRQKVELRLVNDAENRNDWVYTDLDRHKRLFAGTPILIAYVGNKIGDGHNYTEIRNADGSVTASFMSATAERIVGYFPSESDIRLEKTPDDKTWIVGTGYIWSWYARELVSKLKEQGLEGMSVSIETLVNQYHKDGLTEVFTDYEILGTTILGDDVEPAVEGANIRALSAIGTDRLKEITQLKVASYFPNNSEKGEPKPMDIQELKCKYPDYVFLGMNNNRAAFLDENGTAKVCAVTDECEIQADKAEACTVGLTFEDNGECVNGDFETVSSVMVSMSQRIKDLAAQVNEATEKLAAYAAAEKQARKESVKAAIEARISEIAQMADIDPAVCEDMLTDECLDAYAGMENGDAAACKEVDARCMNSLLSAKKEKNNNVKYAWERDSRPQPLKGSEASALRILK